MKILRIQIAYQRFPKLNLSFLRMLVRACLDELFLLLARLVLQRMRPTPGRGWAAHCEDGWGTAYPSLVRLPELLSVDQLRAQQRRLFKTSLHCFLFVYQKIFGLDLSFLRIFVRACLNVFGLIVLDQ
jgi:hypothetical protein